MRARHLPYLLIVAGVVVIGMAIRAWHHFYAEIASDLHVSVWGASHCLYVTPPECRFGVGVTHFTTEIYQPWPFWLGAAMVALGTVLLLAISAARTFKR